MIYKIENIKYDTDGEYIPGLPQSMHIDVDDNLDSSEKLDFISDEISNKTGFCHFGFSTIPTIE